MKIRAAVGLTFDDVLLIPRITLALSRQHVDIASRITQHIAVAVPILSAATPWCTEDTMAIAMASAGGGGFIHRMCLPEQQARMVRNVKQAAEAGAGASRYPNGRLLVGAAVGVTGDYLDRAAILIDAGTDVLVVDVAHGHSTYAIAAVNELKRRYPYVDVLAGNVATAAGANDLADAGADAIKVGIGPGAVCTTRIVTGCGVPQLTAIAECADAAHARGISVIADGGIRTSGDIVKALAAGADCVMLGSLLAGADEAASKEVSTENGTMRVTTGFSTRGMALTLQLLKGDRVSALELRRYVPEGIEAQYEPTGPVEHTLHRLTSGLRSGMSYCGAMTVAELRENAEFVRVTQNALAENYPRATARDTSIVDD